MKSKKIATLIASVVATAQIFTAMPVQAQNVTGAVDTANFIRGVDASNLDMLEDLGAHYY